MLARGSLRQALFDINVHRVGSFGWAPSSVTR